MSDVRLEKSMFKIFTLLTVQTVKINKNIDKAANVTEFNQDQSFHVGHLELISTITRQHYLDKNIYFVVVLTSEGILFLF